MRSSCTSLGSSSTSPGSNSTSPGSKSALIESKLLFSWIFSSPFGMSETRTYIPMEVYLLPAEVWQLPGKVKLFSV